MTVLIPTDPTSFGSAHRRDERTQNERTKIEGQNSPIPIMAVEENNDTKVAEIDADFNEE